MLRTRTVRAAEPPPTPYSPPLISNVCAPRISLEFDPSDSRSLYEKLKAHRDAKQEEFEEKHKFKNQVK